MNIGSIWALAGLSSAKTTSGSLREFPKSSWLLAALNAPDGILSASEGTGYVLRQIGKTRDALPFLSQAIDEFESIRSRLQIADNRQSFFERGTDVYMETIRAYLR